MSRYGFGEAGLAVGTVTGVRWWDLGNGALRGVRAPWTPGENTASCQYNQPELAGTYGPHGDVPDENCISGCGFWAYWQRSDAPETGGKYPVLGVIDGYGRTIIGELGFRCAKARIVALCPMFTIMRPKTHVSRYLWTPDPGMFWRGPDGMKTFQALTGHEPEPLTEDPDALITVANMLEQAYQVPVYSTPAAMLLRHPPTTDYLGASGSIDTRSPGGDCSRAGSP